MEYYTHALTINTETESSYKRHRSPREIHWAEMETKMLEQLGWSGPKIECDLFLFKVDPSPHGVDDGLGLFEDLLLHESRVVALHDLLKLHLEAGDLPKKDNDTLEIRIYVP